MSDENAYEDEAVVDELDPVLTGEVERNDSDLWPDDVPMQSRFGDPMDHRSAQSLEPAEDGEAPEEPKDESPRRGRGAMKVEPEPIPEPEPEPEPELEPEPAPVVEESSGMQPVGDLPDE